MIGINESRVPFNNPDYDSCMDSDYWLEKALSLKFQIIYTIIIQIIIFMPYI